MNLEPNSGDAASAVLSREAIERRILVIRGRRVMIDRNLAELYGVETGALVRAMKRNSERFPEDFAFQLRAYSARPARPMRPIRGASTRRAANRTTSAPSRPFGHWHPRLDPLERTFLPE